MFSKAAVGGVGHCCLFLVYRSCWSTIFFHRAFQEPLRISAALPGRPISRPDSSRGLRGDVGLAVGDNHARPWPARVSGRPLCEPRTPPRVRAYPLPVPTHEALDGAPQARSRHP
jgi:hypothetical protein